MFDAIIEIVEPGHITKYSLVSDGLPLSYTRVLDLWAQDTPFRSYFSDLISQSDFSAYRWETPALTHSTSGQPFEFVLIDTPEFVARATDQTTYSSYFSNDNEKHGIVAFANLSGDSTLVVPSPRTTSDAYGHLSSFVRLAPSEQRDALWRVIGKTVTSKISEAPIWLNTAGGGVAWLHVRIDSRPKYYRHKPYKKIA